ncbi:MAG: AzlD domain-containing protein [Desulfovibrionaceae bacterium]|jgi:branched-subunit amino acid transport protein
MNSQTIFLTILGMAAVTYVPRLAPAWLLSSRTLPPAFSRFLGFVPTAVLAALLVPSLVVHEGGLDFSPQNIFLWAAVPTLLVAWRTRSFFGAVATGVVLVAGARLLFGL